MLYCINKLKIVDFLFEILIIVYFLNFCLYLYCQSSLHAKFHNCKFMRSTLNCFYYTTNSIQNATKSMHKCLNSDFIDWKSWFFLCFKVLYTWMFNISFILILPRDLEINVLTHCLQSMLQNLKLSWKWLIDCYMRKRKAMSSFWTYLTEYIMHKFAKSKIYYEMNIFLLIFTIK